MRFRTFTCWVLLSLILAGCGGSGSPGDRVLSGDQDQDPVVVDFPVAYVKRPVELEDDGSLTAGNVREATLFRPGAELFVRERAAPGAAERSLTDGIFPPTEEGDPALYDVKDLSASFDGNRLLFAMRAPDDPDLEPPPTWNVWMYDRELGTVSRVIASDIVAEAGDDVAPHFLPDGRIVFSSTRQRRSRSILLDENKPQFAALDESLDEPAVTLHVMDADGSDIRQITFNQSSDLDPAVLADGRIVFSRWDNAGRNDRISLYDVNPDGTDLQLLYGVHSHDTGPDGQRVEFMAAREQADRRLLVMLRPGGNHQRMSGIPTLIDTASYVEHDQPTFASTGLLGDAQEPLIAGDLVLDDDLTAVEGRFTHVEPLGDGSNRFLAAWSQCRLLDAVTDPEAPVIVPCTEENLQDATLVEANPLYGLWVFDPDEGSRQPVVVAEEGMAYTEAVVLRDRPLPAVVLDRTLGAGLDGDLLLEGVGAVHVRSVYDFAGVDVASLEDLRDPAVTSAAERPARFVRLVKAVSIPDDEVLDLDGTAFGVSRAQGMREILGYAPVEPDGSIKVRVPADVAFWIEVLDANARRVGGRHLNWLQVRAGETLECNGCHTSDSQLPHGRRTAEAPSANAGAPAEGVPFPGTEDALPARAGESMAETFARLNGIPPLSMDVVFTDVWTDPDLRAKDPDTSFTYASLSSPAPVSAACATTWTPSCRIIIHYETHVHPLWSVDRRVFDGAGTELRDDTCIACHAPVDAMGNPVVPAGNLDLSDGPSLLEARHFNSYRELVSADSGDASAVVQATDAAGNPLFRADSAGNLLRDYAGGAIPLLVNTTLEQPLVTAGANAPGSGRFFSLFAPGGSHAGRLTAAELRLVSEWVDLGAQYYNDPFAAVP